MGKRVMMMEVPGKSKVEVDSIKDGLIGNGLSGKGVQYWAASASTSTLPRSGNQSR